MLGKGVVSEIRLKAFISPLSLRWDWYGLTFYIVTASVQFLLKQKPTSVCKHQSLLILLVLIKYYLPTLFHCDIATLDAVIVPYCPHNCFSPGECLAPTNLFQSAWQKIIFFLMYKKVDTNIFFFFTPFFMVVCVQNMHYIIWSERDTFWTLFLVQMLLGSPVHTKRCISILHATFNSSICFPKRHARSDIT